MGGCKDLCCILCKGFKTKSHKRCEPHEKDIISLTCYADINKKLKRAARDNLPACKWTAPI